MNLVRASVVRISFAVAAATLCCSLAQAAVILPGRSNVPIKDIPFEPDQSSIVQKTRMFDFGELRGTIIDIAELVDGSYAFETRVLITAAPVGFQVNKVSRTDYADFTTDARPEPDRGGDLFPRTADRSAIPGSTVQFNFLPGDEIPQGGTGSSLFAILTNAKAYAEVGELRLGSGEQVFGPITVFSPVAVPIPEPAQWIVLLVGAALLASLARRPG